MSLSCRAGSGHERRLLAEAKFLRAAIYQLTVSYRATALGPDGYLMRLNEARIMIVGLVAIKMKLRSHRFTVVTAPPCYFHEPDLRQSLDALIQEARAHGRRVVLAPKRSLRWRVAPKISPSSFPTRSRSRRWSYSGDQACADLKLRKPEAPARSASSQVGASGGRGER